ncbi:MAG: tetratricopeptide repeat protein [Spirochaetales bacterium]|nr:tetratricopeptide repeat protein [Spirochaetales bacterium]
MRFKFLIILYLFSSIAIFSQDNLPLWIKFQEAKMMYENGDFQDALEFFLSVTSKDTPFPEAEYMIGLLYLEEGELDLAENQIKKAIELSPYLEVKEDILDIKYSLAKIYLLKEDYDSYVLSLKDILGGDELNIEEIRDQNAYYETLIESGIDRLVVLYRKDADSVMNARIYLGYYYNSIGEYSKSVSYLLSPVLAIITEVINDKFNRNREYVFSDMETLFTQISSDKRVIEYFNEHDILKLFYYLAESLYGLDEKDKAKEIWSLLANSSFESMWVNKSVKQLRNPELETWKFIY